MQSDSLNLFDLKYIVNAHCFLYCHLAYFHRVWNAQNSTLRHQVKKVLMVTNRRKSLEGR